MDFFNNLIDDHTRLGMFGTSSDPDKGKILLLSKTTKD